MKEDYDKYLKVFLENGFFLGRLISFSKSFYRQLYPEHLVVFNSNVITSKGEKIWWGDLDLTIDASTLKKISKKIKEELFVFLELDARFDIENKTFESIKDKAIWSSSKGVLINMYSKKTLKLKRRNLQ